MRQVLRDVLIPTLRAKGFRGTLPHFRRACSDRVDYLSVQFRSAGGSFVVEIATASRDGKRSGFGAHLPLEKLNVQYFVHRLRLGGDLDGTADHWYVFGPRSYEAPAPMGSFHRYLEIARQVAADFERQADTWYATNARAP